MKYVCVRDDETSPSLSQGSDPHPPQAAESVSPNPLGVEGSILFNDCVPEEVRLVNICLVPLGLWAISGSGPGLFVPPLGWAGLTVPSDTVQTHLQTFTGEGQQQ